MVVLNLTAWSVTLSPGTILLAEVVQKSERSLRISENKDGFSLGSLEIRSIVIEEGGLNLKAKHSKEHKLGRGREEFISLR